MPIYTYEASQPGQGCPYCRSAFEWSQSLESAALTACPKCGAPVHKVPPRIAIGRSKSSLDARAKAAGFKKLKKLGRGEYERQY
jgi:predicted nucleic acid-binding Zn ribbon protein